MSILLVSKALSFHIKSIGVKKSFSLKMTNTARVILSPIPIVYVYDHCPFCVRVRLALGVKNTKHEIRFLANDDAATPTALVGKKVVPIFVFPIGSQNEKEIIMPESLDIIVKIDSDARFGPTSAILPFSDRTDIKDWMTKNAELFRILQRPRYIKSPLPEFHQHDGRMAYVKNHPFAPYEKNEWQNTLTQDERLKIYDNAYSQSLQRLDEASKNLVELNEMIHSDQYCTAGGFSLDDIDLWSRLRSLTLVKGIKWPSKLRQYMDNLSNSADIPLYDSMAC
eukprot:gene5977-8232_t